MKRFTPGDFPLHGKRLIEASAGTGKTYNIANLYLRLVIGSDQQAPLGVNQILVVTFTRAAATELTGRIRGLLELALRDFRQGHSGHEFLQQLLQTMSQEQRSAALRSLHEALLRMDEASISTIHKFALKLVREFIFETGTLASLEAEQSGDAQSTAAVNDLFRQLSLSKNPQAREIILALNGGDKEKFLRYFLSVNRHHEILPNEVQASDPSADSDHLVSAFEPLVNSAINRCLEERIGLCKRWQALCGQYPVHDWLSEWMSSMEIGAQQNRHKAVDETFRAIEDRLSSASLDKKPLTSGTTLLAQRTRALLGQAGHWADGDADKLAAIELLNSINSHLEEGLSEAQLKTRFARALVAQRVQQRMDYIDPARPALDDLVDMVNLKLQDPQAGPALRASVTRRYPVCLVDEFQDTDPRQFAMFNNLYDENDQENGTGLIMIGDPKQSIFAFRGADIFAYLNVRRELLVQEKKNDPRVFSLDENFRSKAELVTATNILFQERSEDPAQASTFLFEGIPYLPVRASESRGASFRKPRLVPASHIGMDPQPLVFIGNPDDPTEQRMTKGQLVPQFARDTAQRISALLDQERGAALEHRGRKGELIRARLKPGDIAVLVSDRAQASAIRASLAQPEVGLGCVYISQKDSVFSDSEIAEDLYHVLRAINENTDKRRLKTAMATLLMRGFSDSFGEVRSLDTDDDAFEATISEFGSYRDTWLKHGILTALNRLWNQADRRLMPCIARRNDGDRLLTDLRHISDLLEQQDQLSDSPEQVISWYARQLEDDSELDIDARRIRLESDDDLIRISTIHVAKGLEFPVVFVPFFFLPKAIDLNKNLPLHHPQSQQGYSAVVDFETRPEQVTAAMSHERLAEDMRLLYVAITRAIYQCHVGISAYHFGLNKPAFGHTPWAILLDVRSDDGESGLNPGWAEIRQALERRFSEATDEDLVAYCTAGEVTPVRFKPSGKIRGALQAPPEVRPPKSDWEITSYSRLAHGKLPGTAGKDDDDSEATALPSASELLELQQADQGWLNNIRYTLRGGVHTGNALHDTLEQLAINPGDDAGKIAIEQLRYRGLDQPDRLRGTSDKTYARQVQAHYQDIGAWIVSVLQQPLARTSGRNLPCLQDLFERKQVIPEMGFDVRLGNTSGSAHFVNINQALSAAGVASISRSTPISGLLTGAIDLVFCHDRKFYLADYKSNLLGRAPRFYAPDRLGAAVMESRYDLQYMFYSVALHRYLADQLGAQYAYDQGEYQFGGVLYLYLRGMGLGGDYSHHGIWLHRPEREQIELLDQALTSHAMQGVSL